MTRYHSKLRRSLRSLSITVGLAGSLIGLLLIPKAARADDADIIKPEPLVWARVDFLRNRVQLLPHDAAARDARIADLLSVGDSLRTLRRSRAELRFNDDSLARVGERATFRFTPNTRNFQLTNGTVLLLIPPERGRTTIQTPNAVTGIQGSALFVRYIPETNTTIVGALTDNPAGPMVLFNRDGSEQQALEANQIGVIEGDKITQLYRFDSQLFWESSGLAEGIDYSQNASANASDPLDGVREEIREAVSKQAPLPSEGEGVIENPASFSRPASTEPGLADTPETPASTEPSTGSSSSPTTATNGTSSSPSQTQPTTAKPTNNGVPSGETAANGTSNASGVGQTNGASNSTQTATSPSSPLTAEPGVQNTSLGGASEAADPVVELKFKGTPAEAYLAIPLLRTARAPEGANSNSLEPTSPETSSGTGSQAANGSPNTTPAASGSTPARSAPASSTTAGSTPASSIPANSIPASSIPANSIPVNSIPAGLATGSKPAVTVPPAQSITVPSMTLPIDHDSPIIGKPPGSAGSGAAITAPPGTPPTGTPPTNSGTPDDAPPTLSEGAQTPDSAKPIVPILNPSTSLVPVVPTVPPAATDGLPPATNPPLLLNENGGGSTNTIPETAATPTTAVPVIPAAINNPITDVPFKPEVGGSTLEHVLDPINLPANLPGDVPPSTGSAPSLGGGLSSGDAPATGGQTPGQGAKPPETGSGRVLL